MIEFTCNICGMANRASEKLDREKPSCASCGSNVRFRGLMEALSLELFGARLAIADFPRIKSVRGMGLSDSKSYADRLAQKLDYRNTFYTREPRLDIANPPAEEFGKYDFLLSSEVFEHVAGPVEAAFECALRLLKPHGFLLLTVPYSFEAATAEHFADMHHLGLAKVGDQMVLVGRSAEGDIKTFEHPIFHMGVSGPALEMREFSEAGLRRVLLAAGFSEVAIHKDDYLPFGVARAETWSLPVAARKAPFAFRREAAQEVVEQWAALRKHFRELGGEFWVRLGFKLGLIDRRRYFIRREHGMEPNAAESDPMLP